MLSAFRPRLRLPRHLAFSVSAAARKDAALPNDGAADGPEGTNGMTDLADELNKVADTLEKTPTGTVRPVHQYLPFTPNSFLRPYDLSLKGRSFKEHRPQRWPSIPPATRDARKNDVFYQLGLDPLKFSLHPAVLSPFMSEMAMIQPRRITGLTSKSQRRIAKAIRRAKMMGVIPLHSRLRNYGL